MTSDDVNAEISARRRILLVAGAALAVLIIAAVLAIAYDVGGLRTQAVEGASSTYGDVVFRNMRENCIKAASDNVRQSGGDPSTSEVSAMLAGYCDCIVTDTRSQFTISEIAELEKNPATITSNPKVKAIIDRCIAQHLGS